ncbi:hypothetical protein POVCU2_0019450 [Plasmodium ovale curtisi]|uniref:Uncharacterized protein n=1 Tax=Plasmodium ovale curtisi TaxID=864141 RepID=A0A1A8VWH4_PLAOA|nr:hypothetical protein POVCU2_0019450 [Plasmodium ovale curtisi]SBS90028.1 hypothetical protein POVCU1_017420 [Plasmodium ovale curtisi]
MHACVSATNSPTRSPNCDKKPCTESGISVPAKEGCFEERLFKGENKHLRGTRFLQYLDSQLQGPATL